LFLIRDLQRSMPGALQHVYFEGAEVERARLDSGKGTALQGYNPMYAISPEDAEFAFVIAAKIDEAASSLAGAG